MRQDSDDASLQNRSKFSRKNCAPYDDKTEESSFEDEWIGGASGILTAYLILSLELFNWRLKKRDEKESHLLPLLPSSPFYSHGESPRRQQGVELVAFTDQQKLPGGMQGGGMGRGGGVMGLPGPAWIEVNRGRNRRLLHWSGPTVGGNLSTVGRPVTMHTERMHSLFSQLLWTLEVLLHSK